MCDDGLVGEIGKLRVRYRREHEAIRALILQAHEVVEALHGVTVAADECGLDWPAIPPFNAPVPEPLPPVLPPMATISGSLDDAIEAATHRDVEAGRIARGNIIEHELERPFECDPLTLSESLQGIGCFEKDDLTLAQLRQRVQAAIDEAEGLRMMIAEVAALTEAYAAHLVQTECVGRPNVPWFTLQDWHAAWAITDPKRLHAPLARFSELGKNYSANYDWLMSTKPDTSKEDALAQRCLEKALELTARPLRAVLVSIYLVAAPSGHLTTQEYRTIMELAGADNIKGGDLAPDVRLSGVATTLRGVKDEQTLLRVGSRTPPRLIAAYLGHIEPPPSPTAE